MGKESEEKNEGRDGIADVGRRKVKASQGQVQEGEERG